MKLLLRLTPMLLVIMGLFLFVGCEDTEDDEDDHILVGNWALTDMVQSASYSIAADYTIPGGGGTMPAGMPLGSGIARWTFFHDTLGVNATVDMENDFTFTLSGDLPSASDTLGFAPAVVTLNDQGAWTAPEDLSTLLIDGALYDIGGLLDMDDPDNPSVLTLSYADTLVSTMVVPMSATMLLPGVEVQNISATMLEFTRQ